MRFPQWTSRLLTGGALLVMVMASTSCALTEVTMHQPSLKQITTGSHRGEGREVFLVRPFADRRPQTRCGMKKNGYNIETAKVLCDQAPNATLADLVASELAAMGFRVLSDRRMASPSTIVLTGSVDQVFLEPKLNFFWVNFETDIELRLTATTESGLVAERTFYVKGDEASVLATDVDFQRSFDSGARQLVTSVVGAVANLADHFPAAPIAPMVPTSANGVVDPGDFAKTEGVQ